jgi:soluble lytic murein transglycosylase-like protein
MTHRPLSALALVCLIVFSGQVDAAPKSLVAAIIHVESKGNPNVVGRAGEIGLMQIKLQTARGLGYRGTRQGLFHPATNVRYGTAYLGLALKRARGNLCHAASLYQMGVYARPRCTSYGRKVLRAMRR